MKCFYSSTLIIPLHYQALPQGPSKESRLSSFPAETKTRPPNKPHLLKFALPPCPEGAWFCSFASKGSGRAAPAQLWCCQPVSPPQANWCACPQHAWTAPRLLWTYKGCFLIKNTLSPWLLHSLLFLRILRSLPGLLSSAVWSGRPWQQGPQWQLAVQSEASSPVTAKASGRAQLCTWGWAGGPRACPAAGDVFSQRYARRDITDCGSAWGHHPSAISPQTTLSVKGEVVLQAALYRSGGTRDLALAFTNRSQQCSKHTPGTHRKDVERDPALRSVPFGKAETAKGWEKGINHTGKAVIARVGTWSCTHPGLVGEALPPSQHGRFPPCLSCFLTSFLRTCQRNRGCEWSKSFCALNKAQVFQLHAGCVSDRPQFLLHLAEHLPFGSSLPTCLWQETPHTEAGEKLPNRRRDLWVLLSIPVRGVFVHRLPFPSSSQLPALTMRNPRDCQTSNAPSGLLASSRQIQRLAGTDGQTRSDRLFASLGNLAKNTCSEPSFFPQRCAASREAWPSQWTQVVAAVCPGWHLCPLSAALALLPTGASCPDAGLCHAWRPCSGAEASPAVCQGGRWEPPCCHVASHKGWNDTRLVTSRPS